MIKKSYSFMIITFLVMCFMFTNKVNAQYVEFQPNSTYYYTTDNVAHNTSLFSFTGYGYGFKGGRPNVQNNVFAYGWNHYTNVSSLIDISKNYDVSFYVYTSYDNKPMVTFGAYNTCSVESSQTLDTYDSGQILPNSLQQEHVGNIYGVKCTNVTLTDNIDIILVTSEKGLGCYGCTYGTSFDFAYGITTTLKFDLTDSVRENSNNIIESIEKGNQNTNDIKNNTKETNDLIKNDNIDSSSTSSNTSSWSNKNATNGVITQLLTLPITLLQAIVNGVQTTCTTFNLGTLWGTTLEMPCINLSSLIGSALFNVIDLLFSGFMIFAISKKLIKIFNDFTNLKSNQIDELYGGGNQ